MTPHHCRCETCCNAGSVDCPMESNVIILGDFSNQRNSMYDITERIGCLSHPLAREYLTKDVVGELERLQKQYSGIIEHATTKNEEVYHEGKRDSILTVISLIKNGVKPK